MKHYFYCLAMVLLSACCKDGEGVAPRSYFRAQLNGEEWKDGQVWAWLEENDTLSVAFMRYEKDFLRESLYLSRIPLFISTRQILLDVRISDTSFNTPGSNYGTSQDDGDVGCDGYYIYKPDSLDNWVEITEYNKKRKLIKGRFQATYLRDTVGGVCDPTKPDILKFTSGEFVVKLK